MNVSMKTTKKSEFFKDFINPKSIQVDLKSYHRCIGVAELTHLETIIYMHFLCKNTWMPRRIKM